MSITIQATPGATSLNLYAIAWDDPSRSSQIWNQSAGKFTAFDVNSWASYAIPVGEIAVGARIYRTAWEPGQSGAYPIQVYKKLGGGYDPTDEMLKSVEVYYDGSNEITPLSNPVAGGGSSGGGGSGGGTGTTGNVTLDAINRMLETLGEPPATALDSGGTSEVAEAETILLRANTRLQSPGWACNTILETTLTPSGGVIDLDATTLNVRPVFSGYGRIRRTEDPNRQLGMRDGRLYDLMNDTDQFTDDQTVELIHLLDIDDLPPGLKEYIIAAAALEFERYKKRGSIDDQLAGQSMALARIEARREDNRLSGVNVFDTYHTYRIRGGRPAMHYLT